MSIKVYAGTERNHLCSINSTETIYSTYLLVGLVYPNWIHKKTSWRGKARVTAGGRKDLGRSMQV